MLSVSYAKLDFAWLLNKTVEKTWLFKDFDVLFLKYSDWKKKKNQRNWMTYHKNMLFPLHKKYFTSIHLLFEWIPLKIFSKILGSMLFISHRIVMTDRKSCQVLFYYKFYLKWFFINFITKLYQCSSKIETEKKQVRFKCLICF